jgi:protein TonB
VGGATAVDPHAELEARIRSADSVRVARIHEPTSGEAGTAGEDHLNDIVVDHEGRGDAAWRASMAEVIAEAIRRFPEPEICARAPGPRRIQFGVQFVGHDDRTTIVLYLADRCFEVWTGRSFVTSAGLHDLTPRVLPLLRQAFPTDTTVQHLDIKGMISCEDFQREHPDASTIEEAPEVTRKVPPNYPKAAFKAKIEGSVVVQAMIQADGTVLDVKVLESVPELDAAAIDAVRHWEFAPAIDCWGSPVTAPLVIPVRFTLE